MKRIILTLFAGAMLIAPSANAQLLPQFSQYMFNDYMLNPAVGGTNDYWQIKTNYRYQFAGVKNAPQTYMLGGYGPHKVMPMGYGGYIFNDVTGPVGNMGAYGSYSYNLRITGDIRISAGLFLGIVQQKVDLTDVNVELNEGADGFSNSVYKKIYPDASLGVYLYTSQYYAGIAFHHLFFNNMSLLDKYDEGYIVKDGRVKPHFYIQGGYKYNIDRNFDLEPSILIKTVPNYDFMTDINCRVIYQKMVWGGLGFRYNFKNPEAVIVFLGYNYNDMINVGYSYDVTISKLSNASNGSHEIMLGVKFEDIRKSKSKRKIR
ncbi:MAG: type IX secretion system membrane protein PorP/SprF [Salinivirgaceae bacterium]|nr:type IX secretion system membrane protein PorP/SprF [Salinivirgaceae bacterium]